MGLEQLHEGLTDRALHNHSLCSTCTNKTFEVLTNGLNNVSIKSCCQPPICRPVVINLLPNQGERHDQEVFVRNLCSQTPDIPLQSLIGRGIVQVDGTGKIQYLVKEFKPGDTLQQVLTNYETLGIEDEDVARMLNQLGGYLAMFHSIKLPAFGKITGNKIVGPSVNCSWPEYYEFWLRSSIESVSQISPQKTIGALNATDVQKLLPSLQHVISDKLHLLGSVTEPRFVHHDFHLLNVVADDKPEWNITGILDTENATAGDPAIDLVSIESHLFLARNEFYGLFERNMQNFREGYGAWTPSDFSQRRYLYHIPWSLSYFEAVFNMDTNLHPVTSQIVHYAEEHFSILENLAKRRSLEEIGVPSLFS